MRFVKLTFGDPVKMRVRVSLGCHSCSGFGGGGKGRGPEMETEGDGILFLLTRNGLLDFGRGHYYCRGGIVLAS